MTEVQLPIGKQPKLGIWPPPFETPPPADNKCYHEWQKTNGFRFDYMLCVKCGATKEIEQ